MDREGEHYQAALALLDRATAERHRIEAERQAQLADEAAYAAAQRVDTAAPATRAVSAGTG